MVMGLEMSGFDEVFFCYFDFFLEVVFVKFVYFLYVIFFFDLLINFYCLEVMLLSGVNILWEILMNCMGGDIS